MDDQEKQDDQKIQGDQRELLLKIAHCNIADKILDLLISGMDEKEILEKLGNERGKGNKRQPDDSVRIDNCVKICSHQKKLLKASDSKQEFTKAMFHVPEPWSGNLKTAEILFVGSNPNIDLNEVFPKFESEKWPDDEVVKFFGKRENLNSDYWTEILKYAEYILKVTDPYRELDKKNEEDKKRDIPSGIALTETVHCKSKKEKGAQKAAKTCFKKYTKKVIEYFLETPSDSEEKKTVTPPDSRNIKTVVFLGAIARNAICAGAGTNTSNVDRKKIAEYFGVSNQNARFICIPHPSPVSTQWKTWNSGKVVKLGDREEDRKREEIIKEIIDEELKQYGYSLPS